MGAKHSMVRHADVPGDAFDNIAGHSCELMQAIHKARLLSRVDAPLLLEGETGVGKDVFARAVHQNGRQCAGPFIALNCGGLPRDLLASELFGYGEGAFTGARRSGMKGKVEAANGGTLFLDEIGEMPIELQPYLLRVLEDGEFCPLGTNEVRTAHFRLIAASNRELRLDVASGRFRSDLYYRISVTSVHIPALRERTDDIPDLVDRFLTEIAAHHGVQRKDVTPRVVAAFKAYAWPGNIRELRNVLETMLLLADGDVLDLSLLPPELVLSHAGSIQPPGIGVPLSQGLKGVERDAIAAAIETHAGNATQVAADLRISKSTLYAKLKHYSLEALLNEVRQRSSHPVRQLGRNQR